MDILIQVASFIISFFYGVFIYVMIKCHKKHLNNKHPFFTTVFFLDIGLLYFLIMKCLNNGVINIYFLLFLCLGGLIKKCKVDKKQ